MTENDTYHPNIELIRNSLKRNWNFWPAFAVQDIAKLLSIVDAYTLAVNELREADANYWAAHADPQMVGFEQAEIARDAAIAKVLETMGEKL